MQVWKISGGVWGSGFNAAYDLRPDDVNYGTLYEVAKAADGSWHRVPGGRGQNVDQGDNAATLTGRFNDPTYSGNLTPRLGYYANKLDGEFFNHLAMELVIDEDTSLNEVSEVTDDGELVGIEAFTKLTGVADAVITYELSNDADGRFAIDGQTGVVSVANASLLDYEVDAEHVIEVIAKGPGGETSTNSFTINLNDVGVLEPTDINTDDNKVSELVSNDIEVGLTVNAIDPDGSSSDIRYALVNDAGGLFKIDSTTGVVSVANASLLDYETTTSHVITASATCQYLDFMLARSLKIQET